MAKVSSPPTGGYEINKELKGITKKCKI